MIEIIYYALFAPQCHESKLDALLSEPNNIAEFTEVIDCNLKLPENTIVKKRLIFNKSGVIFDCNGSKILPDKQFLIADGRKETIKVASRKTVLNNQEKWTATENVEIKNCSEVGGSVRVDSPYVRNEITNSFINYKNNQGPSYVIELRESAPKKIKLQNIHIKNNFLGSASLYIEQGVTEVTFTNSSIAHETEGPSVYLAPEGGYHRIEDSVFHHSSQNETVFGINNGRELLAIDGSEGNVISNNVFSGLNDGGIFLYRNCGENGQIRYVTPSNNLIINNTFYYRNATSPEPGVFIASRNGVSPGEVLGFGGYCDFDEGYGWMFDDVPSSFDWDEDWQSSSTLDNDLARYNTVSNNYFCNREPHIVINESDLNYGNVVLGNLEIQCE